MRLALLVLMVLLPAAAADDPLIFAFFRNNGEDGLYLAASDDGLIWRSLNGDKPLLHPQVGEAKLMRDPSIARGPDGAFHMVWTTSWQGRTIGYAASKDLIHWTAQRAIPIELGGEVLNCWAPEIFFDERSKDFRVVWASTVRERFPETLGKATRDYNHRQYSFRTGDFQSISKPELFFDPGFQVIDAALFRHGKRYGMVAKNETLQPPAKYLFLSFAASLEGPWTKPGDPICDLNHKVAVAATLWFLSTAGCCCFVVSTSFCRFKARQRCFRSSRSRQFSEQSRADLKHQIPS